MRIKEQFAKERISEQNEYRPKFFIASEGSTSEPKYFEGLNQSIISENITIINILRDYATLHNSHPTFLTQLLSDFIENSDDGVVTVKELKNRILNWEHENPNKINVNQAISELDELYKNDNYRIPFEELDELFLKLFKSDIYIDLAKNFSLYFTAQDVTYSETTDSLNMIIDRDKDNFFEEQYDEVVKFCEENNINLYISNPNFEFWLMLHFDEVESEDKQKMYNNEKVNSKRRYLEKRLHDICGYTKKRVDFKRFEPNIMKAVEREKNYEENIKKLKDNLGTNVGVLVNKIVNSK